MTQEGRAFAWSFVGKGALIGAAIYVLLLLPSGLYGKAHPEAFALVASTTTFQSLWGFSARPATGTRNLAFQHLRHFSAGFVGSLLYIHAFKSDGG